MSVYSKEELFEAKRQIDSTIHKLTETLKTLESKENPDRSLFVVFKNIVYKENKIPNLPYKIMFL
jgi:hypothetical protein